MSWVDFPRWYLVVKLLQRIQLFEVPNKVGQPFQSKWFSVAKSMILENSQRCKEFTPQLGEKETLKRFLSNSSTFPVSLYSKNGWTRCFYERPKNLQTKPSLQHVYIDKSKSWSLMKLEDGSLFVCLVGWLAGWLFICLVGWLVRLVVWFGCLSVCLV